MKDLAPLGMSRIGVGSVDHLVVRPGILSPLGGGRNWTEQRVGRHSQPPLLGVNYQPQGRDLCPSGRQAWGS